MIASCAKDRVGSTANSSTSGVLLPPVINEFLASGSLQYNELITPADSAGSDWIELYNPNNETLQLQSNEWYMTDSLGMPTKYLLPAITLSPHGFFMIWADGMDTVINQVHTNFKLSKSGEQIGLFHIHQGDSMYVDQLNYPLQQSGISEGRLPDGSPNWIPCNIPTPDQSNR